MTGSELTRQEWTYLGRAITTNGKVGQLWDGPNGRGVYLKPVVSGASIGAVYAITCEGTSLIISGPDGPQYLRRSDAGAETQITWVARDAEALAEQQRKAAITAAGKVTPLEDLLDTLRRIRTRTTAPQRRALAVLLLRELGL